MNNNKITINNLIYSLIFLVLGILLLTTSSDIISLASKVIGSILIIFGIIKSIVYIYMKGKLGAYKISELLLGIITICLGTLFIIVSPALGFVIRTVVGFWTLFAGINRIILAISIKSIDKIGFRTYLITSIIMILIGIILISGLFNKIIGLFIIIYAITEIVDYVYYKCKNKDEKTNVKKQKNKKLIKSKNQKVIEAVIEE